MLGCFATLLITLAALGLGDMTRQQVELVTGYYDLPFKITVPWYIAGDIFVLMIIIAIFIYMYAVYKKVE